MSSNIGNCFTQKAAKNMFIRIIIVSLTTLMGLLFTLKKDSYLDDSGSPTDFCEIKEICFEDGEEIVYDVYYNAGFLWFKVGHAIFRVKSNSENFYFTAIGVTNESYQWVFPVHDTVYSVVDRETFRTKWSARSVHEGNYDRYDHTKFNRSTHMATSNHGPSKSDTQEKTFSFPACANDILTTLYAIRGKGMSYYEKNPETGIEIVMDQKIYPIDIHYLGLNKVRVKGIGTAELHTFNPELISSTTFKDTDQMRVYVSKDGNNIPIMLESPISVGRVKAILQTTRNLKYPRNFN